MKRILIILTSLFLISNVIAGDGDIEILKSGAVIAFSSASSGTHVVTYYQGYVYSCEVGQRYVECKELRE